jgi:hypothetical protein
MIGDSNCENFDLPSGEVLCYYDGALCKSDPGYCSRTYSTETLATSECGSLCKVDPANAKKCAVKTCADLGDGSCTGSF